MQLLQTVECGVFALVWPFQQVVERVFGGGGLGRGVVRIADVRFRVRVGPVDHRRADSLPVGELPVGVATLEHRVVLGAAHQPDQLRGQACLTEGAAARRLVQVDFRVFVHDLDLEARAGQAQVLALGQIEAAERLKLRCTIGVVEGAHHAIGEIPNRNLRGAAALHGEHEDRCQRLSDGRLRGDQQPGQVHGAARRVLCDDAVARRERARQLGGIFVLNFRQHHGQNRERAQHQEQRNAAAPTPGQKPPRARSKPDARGASTA